MTSPELPGREIEFSARKKKIFNAALIEFLFAFVFLTEQCIEITVLLLSFVNLAHFFRLCNVLLIKKFSIEAAVISYPLGLTLQCF